MRILYVCSFLLIFLCFTFAHVIPNRLYSPVPFLLWGPSVPKVSEHIESQRSSSLSDVIFLLESAINVNAKPEVLVAFVAPQLSSSQASYLSGAYSPVSSSFPLSHLKSSFSSSASSISIPNLLLEHSSVTHALLKLFHRLSLSRGSETIKGAVKDNRCDLLLAGLRNANIFSDGATDLVLLNLDDPNMASNDMCIDRVLQYLSSAATDKYLSLFSADSSPSIQTSFPTHEQSFVAPVLLQAHTFATTTATGNCTGTDHCPSGVYYITSDILFGLLFGLFFLSAALVGICCLDSIQTPLRFLPPNRKFPVGKEY